MDDHRLMARSLAYIWLAGASLLSLTLTLPNSHERHLGALITIAALAYATAIVMLAVRGLPTRAFESILTLGLGLISLLLVLDNNATSAYALFYLWLIMHAFYFLPWRRAMFQLLFAIGAFTAVLIAEPGPDERLVPFAMVVGTLLAASAFVGLLKRRVDRLVGALSDAARRDFLTGLLNRGGFDQVFQSELERVRRGARPLSLLACDLDHFKAINDVHGHHAGDDILRLVADVLRTSARGFDTLARMGGEEFALLLPDTEPGDAVVVAERIREALRLATTEREPRVTMSIGVATFPSDGNDPQSLMRAADEALYASKDMGRDRTLLFSPDLSAMLGRAREQADARPYLDLAKAIALADTLDMREQGVPHSRAVGQFAELIAREMGLSADRIERIRLAGRLHDIGKIGIPDSILHKPGPLNPEEREQMQRHPEIGAGLLSGHEMADIREWVRAHHERLDGTGYPKGLDEHQIPLEAQIIAAAEAFEEMTSDRIYRPALGLAAARDELIRGRGTQFGERVVDALLAATENVPAMSSPIDGV